MQVGQRPGPVLTGPAIVRPIGHGVTPAVAFPVPQWEDQGYGRVEPEPGPIIAMATAFAGRLHGNGFVVRLPEPETDIFRWVDMWFHPADQREAEATLFQLAGRKVRGPTGGWTSTLPPLSRGVEGRLGYAHLGIPQGSALFSMLIEAQRLPADSPCWGRVVVFVTNSIVEFTPSMSSRSPV